jgi:hypothetical protein
VIVKESANLWFLVTVKFIRTLSNHRAHSDKGFIPLRDGEALFHDI